MIAALTQLISVCADKLHLANLVDAYADLIRSRAFWNYANSFDTYAFLGSVVIIALFISYRQTR